MDSSSNVIVDKIANDLNLVIKSIVSGVNNYQANQTNTPG